MEKEVKTIGQEVTKAVETMKEAGKQGKQPQQQPEKEENNFSRSITSLLRSMSETICLLLLISYKSSLSLM